jgi:hypothetical protein
MRTISNILKKKLMAQVDEANFQGLDKIANNLNYLVKTSSTRPDRDEYIYSHASLKSDMEKLLWTAAVRVQDYFGKTANAQDIDSIIEAHANDLIAEIKHKIGGNIIGPYEPLVAGELRNVVEIEE